MRDGFAKTRQSSGSCCFAPHALEGNHGDGDNGASIRVDRERGPVVNLNLRVNATGKFESLYLLPRPGAEEAPRCTNAPTRP
jgi:hypothetical protein